MVDTALAFLIVACLVIVTPGPDTALTIRNTLIGGRGAGIATAFGVSAGQATWTLAAAAGVAAVLAASESVYRAVRIVGGLYLAYLGAQAIYGAIRHRTTESALGPARPATLPPMTAFRQGLISNLTNPKMAAFFPALLPQFAPDGPAAFFVLLGLGLVFSLMTLAWLTGYAIAVAKAGDFLRRPSIRRLFEASTGAVLIALGLRLATERSKP